MKRCAVKLTCGRIGGRADWWYSTEMQPEKIIIIYEPIEQPKPDKISVPCCNDCMQEIIRRFRQ